MTDSTAIGRLLPDTVREYVSSGQRTAHTVGPGMRIEIDPPASRVSLRVPAAGPLPDLSRFDHVDVVIDGDHFVIRFEANGADYEAYAMLHAASVLIAGGALAADALPSALEAFRDLLRQRSRLSDEQETGLFGELAILNALLDVVPADTALTAWLGPTAQPHDFALPDSDLEVKTTRSARHIHTISSLDQLSPVGERPLTIAAIRIAASGSATDGVSLAAAIAALRKRLHGHTNRFDRLLGGAGWLESSADLHTRRFRVTDVRFHSVDQTFPAITRRRLDAVVPNASLVLNASYRVDLTDVPSTDPPSPLIAPDTIVEGLV